MSYTPATYVQNKVPTIVKDFGAVGDRQHDDSLAINAAIQAATPSGTIYFPHGIYLCLSPIVVKPNIAFLGEGQNHISGFSAPATTIRDGRTNPSSPLIHL